LVKKITQVKLQQTETMSE